MEESKISTSTNLANKTKSTLTHLRRLTVPQLKIYLEELGLDTDGKREGLYDGLRSALYPVVKPPNPNQTGGGHFKNLEYF